MNGPKMTNGSDLDRFYAATPAPAERPVGGDEVAKAKANNFADFASDIAHLRNLLLDQFSDTRLRAARKATLMQLLYDDKGLIIEALNIAARASVPDDGRKAVSREIASGASSGAVIAGAEQDR